MIDLVANDRSSRVLHRAEAGKPCTPGAVVDQTQLISDILDCWTGLDGRHRLVLNRHGQIAICGKQTRHFLERSRDFRIGAGRLLTSNPQYTGRFYQLYSDARAEVRTAIVPMGDGGGHWICRAAGIAANSAESLVGLTIQPASADQRSEWVDLREILHLTESEHAILREFLAGQAPQTIAACHRLSINTVRTHFRHIYDKLDVANHHELRQKLAAYRLR